MTLSKVLVIITVTTGLLFQTGWTQQSTTGPVPPPDIDRGLRPAQRADVVIPGVPAYIWQHGCGPTAVGMVVGYWDGCGFSELVPGDATSQTAAVNAMIADDSNNPSCSSPASDHYQDYSCPKDYSPNPIQPDLSELGGAHTDNCVADFMRTSWSLLNNYYGWSWLSNIPGSFTQYVDLVAPGMQVEVTNHYFDFSLWNMYKEEIDSNRPVVLLVDTDGNGSTDHFVTGIGYNDVTTEYGIHDTWDSQVHWFYWQQMETGSPWGIRSVTIFDVTGVSVAAQNSFGPVPLTVSFEATAPGHNIDSCHWLFGDGDSSAELAPVHEYQQPGYHTVSLTAYTPAQPFDRIIPGLVSAYADTMRIAELNAQGGTPVPLNIYSHNFLPLKEITIPFSWTGPPNVTFDSFSTAGLRTEYFAHQVVSNYDPFNKRACILLSQNAQPYLEPGADDIVSLWFTIPFSAALGTYPVEFVSYAGFEPSFVTYAGEYVPIQGNGAIIINCCVGNRGNILLQPLCTPPDEVVDITDLTNMISHLFISFTPYCCLEEADIAPAISGGQPDDVVDISDLTDLIDHLFISYPPMPSCD